MVVVVVLVSLGGCADCVKRRGYVARNCTNDTLLLEVTESDTLNDWMYWGVNPGDTVVGIYPFDSNSKQNIHNQFYFCLCTHY